RSSKIVGCRPGQAVKLTRLDVQIRFNPPIVPKRHAAEPHADGHVPSPVGRTRKPKVPLKRLFSPLARPTAPILRQTAKQLGPPLRLDVVHVNRGFNGRAYQLGGEGAAIVTGEPAGNAAAKQQLPTPMDRYDREAVTHVRLTIRLLSAVRRAWRIKPVVLK